MIQLELETILGRALIEENGYSLINHSNDEVILLKPFFDGF